MSLLKLNINNMKKIKNILSSLFVLALLLANMSVFTAQELTNHEIDLVQDISAIYDGEFERLTIYNNNDEDITEYFYNSTLSFFRQGNYKSIYEFMKEKKVWFSIDNSFESAEKYRSTVVEKYVNQSFNYPDYWGGSSGALYTVKVIVSGSYLYYPTTQTFSHVEVGQSVNLSGCTLVTKSLTRTNFSSYIRFNSSVTIKDKENGRTHTHASSAQ